MSEADLDVLFKVEEKKLEYAKSDFKAAVAKLQDYYTALSPEKNVKIEVVKGFGLSVMKSVKSLEPAGSNEL